MLRSSLVAFVVLLCFTGCGDSPVEHGGSGTDAGNVLTVWVRTPEGTAQAGARVDLRPVEELPDSLGTPPTYTATTDAGGCARITVSDGRWAVLVRDGHDAFWAQAGGGDTLMDTLKPMGRLSGQLRGAPRAVIGLRGLGISTLADTLGNFSLVLLPSGNLPVVVVRPVGRMEFTVPVPPGSSIGISGHVDSMPSVPDTATVPQSSMRQALGDTGTWAFATQFVLREPVGTTRVIHWTDGISAGIDLRWSGGDTLVAWLDGATHIFPGLPLDTSEQHVGISYARGSVDIYLEAVKVASAPLPSGENRTLWLEPLGPDPQVVTLLGMSVARGVQDSAWFAQIAATR